jgi:hypothetical protein
VNASTASVTMWRVTLWGIFHAILVTLGFVLRAIHTHASHPWIDHPAVAAFLVDPTSLTSDPNGTEKLAGEYTPSKLNLHDREKKKYIVLERSAEDKDEKKDNEPEGDPEKQQ